MTKGIRRAAVTGGAGFIGSHLADRLISSGYEVLVIDDFSSGLASNLEQHKNNPRLSIEKADVRDTRAMPELMRGIDCVFHLAVRNVRLSLRQPTIVHDVNVNGTLNVLKAAAAAGVARFLYCSSSEVNGAQDGGGALPEDCFFKPETIYGASKLAGEYYTGVFHRAGWLNTVIARPNNNYGPRSHYGRHSGEVIPRFVISALAGKPLTIYGDGAQTRDFTYVAETADLMAALAEVEVASGGVFNICTGEATSVREIADLVLELTGSDSQVLHLPPRPGDIASLTGNPSRLRQALNRAPEISFRHGLSLYVDWIKQNIRITEEVLSSIGRENWAEVEPEPWMLSLSEKSRGEKQWRKQVVHGSESRENEIPITVPAIGEREAEAAKTAVLSGWVTQGPRVREFEESFAEYTGAPYACAVSNCTAAVFMALKAAGVRPGDVVLTVSHSFIATANAVRFCGAEPVFIDIDPDTLDMDCGLLAGSLENDFESTGGGLMYRDARRLAVGESPLCYVAAPIGRLAAILVVHQIGMPADIERIVGIARNYGLPVVEDAACAAGSEIKTGAPGEWEKIGHPHGDIACFSFHPRKVITTGEGGMIVTANPRFDETFRLLRHQGMSVSDLARHESRSVVFENYPAGGFNFRMTDIQAAIGIEQMKKLPEIVEKRRRLARLYDDALRGMPGITIFQEPPYARSNRQSYIVRLSDTGMQRNVMEKLLEKGIHTRRGIMCAHLEPPYTAAWPSGTLPHSERARDCGITLPLYPDMSGRDVAAVSAALRDALVK
jgi:perosamine synthetase